MWYSVQIFYSSQSGQNSFTIKTMTLAEVDQLNFMVNVIQFLFNQRAQKFDSVNLPDSVMFNMQVEGVRVCILIYKELELVLNLGSAFAKDYLNNLHPNIMVSSHDHLQTCVYVMPYKQVLRHPDHLSEGILLWAHHEKVVVIDQTVAYVGGQQIM